MRRALLLVLAAAALLLPACREDRARAGPTPREEALLKEKADERIERLVREGDDVPFAGLVVFRSDVFLSQSAMLESRDLAVLDTFGKAAVIRLSARDIPAIVAEPSVRKVRYLCRQGPLARLHPAFLMELLLRFSEDRENEPISLLVRFRGPAGADEAKTLQAAGFAVTSIAGAVATLSGPPSSLHRLLDDARIIYYEGASKTRGM